MWKGSAFGGVKGRSELPGIVEQVSSTRIAVDLNSIQRSILEKSRFVISAMIEQVLIFYFVVYEG